MHIEYITFATRQERMAYVARSFSPLLHAGQARVLDVGCDQAYLRQLLPQAVYTGIDRSPAADIEQDLEKQPILPFPDKSFDCVLCIDVLEHLDSLHQVFAELIRVSGAHVVISWHNCWVNARRPLARGRGSFSHYGLPPDPPADRHKWFFNIREAEAFVREQEQRLPFRIEELFVTEKPRPLPLRLLRRLAHPRQSDYLNRYAHTLWSVLQRRD
jgi:SAM-dependent methyltransferase